MSFNKSMPYYSKTKRQTLDLAKQTLPEILESAEKNGTTDTLIYYARKIFNACGNNYINANNTRDGIDYMDSIGNHPLIREHCPHELLSFKAGLNQLYGNNPAVRLAEDPPVTGLYQCQ